MLGKHNHVIRGRDRTRTSDISSPKTGLGSISENGTCVYDDNDRALTLKLAGFSRGVTQRQKFQEQEKFQETKFFIKDRY